MGLFNWLERLIKWAIGAGMIGLIVTLYCVARDNPDNPEDPGAAAAAAAAAEAAKKGSNEAVKGLLATTMETLGVSGAIGTAISLGVLVRAAVVYLRQRGVNVQPPPVVPPAKKTPSAKKKPNAKKAGKSTTGKSKATPKSKAKPKKAAPKKTGGGSKKPTRRDRSRL